jgi:hypothetical protein
MHLTVIDGHFLPYRQTVDGERQVHNAYILA